MTLPLDTTPLHDAIERALSQVTGQPRCLKADELFVLLAPVEGAGLASKVKARPGVWVDVGEEADAGPNLLEMSDRGRVAVRVRITCSYFGGGNVGTAERRKARKTIARSTRRLRDALCYPGALELDPAGDETGVDGGAMNPAGWSTVGPPPQPAKNDAPHVLQVVHTIRTTVEYLHST